MTPTPLDHGAGSAATAPDTAPAAEADAPADTSHCCDDPHHDHGRTGADVVSGLTRGFAILALVVPFLALVLLLASLAHAPSTPAVLLLGLLLGSLHLATLVGTTLVVARTSPRVALSPGLLAARSVLEEALRLAVVLLALVLWPTEPRSPIGLWLGVGCALVWAALATAQLVAARRRIVRPSDWSREMVATLLQEKVGVGRTMLVRLADITGLMLFQVGASVLVAAAPVMTVATIVLSMATGLSTLVLQRRSPAQRARSPWALAPLGIGLLLLVLALVAAVCI